MIFKLIWMLIPPHLRPTFVRFWFNSRRRRTFYLKVAELYSNSVKLDDIIASLQRRAEKKDKKGIDAWLYKSIFTGLASTGSLAEGTRKFVPVIDQILIKAGEQSGDLAKTLYSAADLNEKTGRMKGMVRKAVAYPIFMLLMLLAVICWFGSTLFPTMVDFLPVEQWPNLSRNVYRFSQFILAWWPVVLGVFLGLFILIRWSFPNLTGPFRIRLDRIPPWSLYRLSQGGAWIMSISSMVAAGTMNIEALNIIYNESKGNRWLRERTKAVRDNISRSQSMGEALTTRYMFPDPELCDDMADYAKSADFNSVFEKVGKEWIETGVEKVNEQAAKLNGASTGVIMLGIVMMVISILSLLMHFANQTSTMAM